MMEGHLNSIYGFTKLDGKKFQIANIAPPASIRSKNRKELANVQF